MSAIIGALLVGKWLAAEIAGRAFAYTPTARKTMWSLTLPQVAATLAATLVAYDTFDPAGQRGPVVNTDEYVIYDAWPPWGYVHKRGCHSRGEYARDEDGDGVHEVQVNTREGCWSLWRSWRCPHRGLSQEKLPIYLGFFEFAPNVRRRVRALLGALLETLLQPVVCPQNPI